VCVLPTNQNAPTTACQIYTRISICLLGTAKRGTRLLSTAAGADAAVWYCKLHAPVHYTWVVALVVVLVLLDQAAAEASAATTGITTDTIGLLLAVMTLMEAHQ
jgi:hypothetical protein